MPIARLCLLADVAHQIPAGCWLADEQAQDTAALSHQPVLYIEGDVQLAQLDLGAPMASGSPLREKLQRAAEGENNGNHAAQTPLFLIFITGNLRIDGALTSAADHPTHLIVAGDAHLRNAVLVGSHNGPQLVVQGALQVDDLLWGHAHRSPNGQPRGLHALGGLQARVALFTGAYPIRVEGSEQVAFLMDEVRRVPHRAEFSSEIMGAVFALEFHAGGAAVERTDQSADVDASMNRDAPKGVNDCMSDGMSEGTSEGISAGEGSLAAMLNRHRILAALRAGQSVVRSSADIHAAQPLADGLCAGDAISIDNITAVVRSPVIAHKETQAIGWFGQTDFALCRRHIDEEGDQREDSVYLTVWKKWDFYLAVEPEPTIRGPLPRLTALLGRRAPPAGPQLTLAYRRYANGQPGAWQALLPGIAAGTTPSAALDTGGDGTAWQACRHAWRGMLDYVRKATGQHRARYPLHQRVLAQLTPQSIETFTSVPVFTERYNDWWDSDRNGWWEGEVWVGARQPCMYRGEPWGRTLKLSWKNGTDAPGDAKDNAHSAYQLDVDEARQGPAVVKITYSQRQSDSRIPLPRHAADHMARLLRLYEATQESLRASGLGGLGGSSRESIGADTEPTQNNSKSRRE